MENLDSTTGGIGAAIVAVLGACAAAMKKSSSDKNQMASDLQECKGKISNMEGHMVELREQAAKNELGLNAMVMILQKMEDNGTKLADNGAKLTALLEKDHEVTAIHRENMQRQLDRIEAHK